jgi:hypothetical protein
MEARPIMKKSHIEEIAQVCAKVGLIVEIVEPDDGSGPFVILKGGLPSPEIIQKINQQISLIEPRIRKILLEIPHDKPNNQR